LEQRQVGLVFEARPNGLLVQQPIGLRPGRAYCRALAGIEDAKLDSGFVRRQRHGAAQCVDLLDEVSLADTADRRIARHLPQRFDAVGKKQGASAHARRRERSLRACVAATDDYDLEPRWEQHVFKGKI
jgi:hypothetical protein